MRRLAMQFVVWWLRRSFNRSLKLVLGHSTVAQARHEEFYLRRQINKENGCNCGDKRTEELTWENTPKTDRAVFARWLTLVKFCEWGETLALFHTMEFPKIMEALGGKNGDR